MENCIFCKMIKGEISNKKIYEDDDIYAFLDINPLSPGHTLIIPKKHTLDIQTIDKVTLEKIIDKAKMLSNEIVKKLNADGYSLVQNNGISQNIKHFHLHIIPKYNNKFEISLEDVYKKIIT